MSKTKPSESEVGALDDGLDWSQGVVPQTDRKLSDWEQVSGLGGFRTLKLGHARLFRGTGDWMVS